MAYKNILSRCDLLPGGYVLLSKYQEEGIYHLEDWHKTQKQKMMNLIHPRYFKPDCKEQRGRSDGPQPTDPNHHTSSHHNDHIEKRQNLSHNEGVDTYSNENGRDGIPLPTDHNHHTFSHHNDHIEEIQNLSHTEGVNTYFNKNGQDRNSFANDQHHGQIIESAYSTNTPPNTQNNQNIHRDDGDDGNDGDDDEEDYDSDHSIFSDGDDFNNNEHGDEDSDSDDDEKDDEKEKGEADGDEDEDDGEETSDGETSDDESEFEDNNDDRMANLCIPGTDNIFLYQDMDVTQTEDNTVHNIVNVLNVNVSEPKTETVDMVERRDEVVGEQCGESTSSSLSPSSSPIISFVFTEFINVKYRIYRQKVIKHPEIFGQFAVCVSLTMFVGFLFNIIKRH